MLGRLWCGAVRWARTLAFRARVRRQEQRVLLRVPAEHAVFNDYEDRVSFRVRSLRGETHIPIAAVVVALLPGDSVVVSIPLLGGKWETMIVRRRDIRAQRHLVWHSYTAQAYRDECAFLGSA